MQKTIYAAPVGRPWRGPYRSQHVRSEPPPRGPENELQAKSLGYIEDATRSTPRQPELQGRSGLANCLQSMASPRRTALQHPRSAKNAKGWCKVYGRCKRGCEFTRLKTARSWAPGRAVLLLRSGK